MNLPASRCNGLWSINPGEEVLDLGIWGGPSLIRGTVFLRCVWWGLGLAMDLVLRKGNWSNKGWATSLFLLLPRYLGRNCHDHCILLENSQDAKARRLVIPSWSQISNQQAENVPNYPNDLMVVCFNLPNLQLYIRGTSLVLVGRFVPGLLRPQWLYECDCLWHDGFSQILLATCILKRSWTRNICHERRIWKRAWILPLSTSIWMINCSWVIKLT
jgi:hypothetical protein